MTGDFKSSFIEVKRDSLWRECIKGLTVQIHLLHMLDGQKQKRAEMSALNHLYFGAFYYLYRQLANLRV